MNRPTIRTYVLRVLRVFFYLTLAQESVQSAFNLNREVGMLRNITDTWERHSIVPYEILVNDNEGFDWVYLW